MPEDEQAITKGHDQAATQRARNAARSPRGVCPADESDAPAAPESVLHERSNTDTPHLVDGKYSIKDLVDIERLSRLLERFSRATGFDAGLVSYPDQEILFATGWKDICAKFHRACPESERRCIESNRRLTEQLKDQRQFNINPCAHGLVDGATPHHQVPEQTGRTGRRERSRRTEESVRQAG